MLSNYVMFEATKNYKSWFFFFFFGALSCKFWLKCSILKKRSFDTLQRTLNAQMPLPAYWRQPQANVPFFFFSIVCFKNVNIMDHPFYQEAKTQCYKQSIFLFFWASTDFSYWIVRRGTPPYSTVLQDNHQNWTFTINAKCHIPHFLQDKDQRKGDKIL